MKRVFHSTCAVWCQHDLCIFPILFCCIWSARCKDKNSFRTVNRIANWILPCPAKKKTYNFFNEFQFQQTFGKSPFWFLEWDRRKSKYSFRVILVNVADLVCFFFLLHSMTEHLKTIFVSSSSFRLIFLAAIEQMKKDFVEF